MVGHDEARKEMKQEMNDPDMKASIPYFPGYEPLWVGNSMARAQVDENEIVNPIADGAEAYYTYETGDSVSFKLPNGTVIQLRELKVRPRAAEVESRGRLAVVRYEVGTARSRRVSARRFRWTSGRSRTEEDPKSMDDVPVWVKPMITPMKAEISAIAVEYGLHEGRFWMPRLRMAEGSAQVSFMHVPFKMEESFKYASVNGKDSLPQIKTAPFECECPIRSISRSSRCGAILFAWWRVHVCARRTIRFDAACESATSAARSATRRTFASSRRRATTASCAIATRIPCDVSKLETSSDLPESIYDPGEELFGVKELDALKAEALSMSAQAPFSFRLQAGLLPPPSVAYGPSMMRYNRVEGLSLGASVEQQLGGGYSGAAIGRIGLADWQPNVELSRHAHEHREIGSVSALQPSRVGERLGTSAQLRQLVLGADVRARRRILLSRDRRSSFPGRANRRSAAERESSGARSPSRSARPR